MCPDGAKITRQRFEGFGTILIDGEVVKSFKQSFIVENGQILENNLARWSQGIDEYSYSSPIKHLTIAKPSF